MTLDSALRAPDAFSRTDESDDARFYERERLVHHLDARARATVRRVIGTLVVEERPAVLDLMASIDSHLPEAITPREVVGLGMNEVELESNDRLDRRVVHDLNRDPRLPFDDETFDVVLNTVSIDYLVKPFAVFAEVARVLRPGGIFLVTISNRYFPQKVVQVWRDSDEQTRNDIVQRLFASVPDFRPTRCFSSRGKARPADDKYAALGLPSDPVTAIYAEKAGAPEGRTPRPEILPEPDPCPPPEVVEERKKHVGETLRCPYCDSKLEKFEIPPNPFCEWPDEFVWVCLNNACGYLLDGWDTMAAQGNVGYSYRLMYNPTLKRCMPTPIARG